MGKGHPGAGNEKGWKGDWSSHICSQGLRDRKGVELPSLAAFPKAKGV